MNDRGGDVGQQLLAQKCGGVSEFGHQNTFRGTPPVRETCEENLLW
jgi:hypothetical protein